MNSELINLLSLQPITAKYTISEDLLWSEDSLEIEYYRCTNLETTESFLLKLIPSHRSLFVEREIQVWKVVQSLPFQEHLVSFIEGFRDDDFFFLVYPSYDLSTLPLRIAYSNLVEVSSDLVRTWIRQLTTALSHLHQSNIAFRSLNLSTIRMHSDEQGSSIRLIDFSFAKTIKQGETNTYDIGTIWTVAPEIISNPEGTAEPYTVAADMWSLGVLTYYLIFKRQPFPAEFTFLDMFQTIKRKVSENQLDNDLASENVDPAIKTFISSLLVMHPAQRPSAQDLLCTGWLSESYFADSQGSIASTSSLSSSGMLPLDSLHYPSTDQRILVSIREIDHVNNTSIVEDVWGRRFIILSTSFQFGSPPSELPIIPGLLAWIQEIKTEHGALIYSIDCYIDNPDLYTSFGMDFRIFLCQKLPCMLASFQACPHAHAIEDLRSPDQLQTENLAFNTLESDPSDLVLVHRRRDQTSPLYGLLQTKDSKYILFPSPHQPRAVVSIRGPISLIPVFEVELLEIGESVGCEIISLPHFNSDSIHLRFASAICLPNVTLPPPVPLFPFLNWELALAQSTKAKSPLCLRIFQPNVTSIGSIPSFENLFHRWHLNWTKHSIFHAESKYYALEDAIELPLPQRFRPLCLFPQWDDPTSSVGLLLSRSHSTSSWKQILSTATFDLLSGLNDVHVKGYFHGLLSAQTVGIKKSPDGTFSFLITANGIKSASGIYSVIDEKRMDIQKLSHLLSRFFRFSLPPSFDFEAKHLCKLLRSPNHFPLATLLNHPFFWDDHTKVAFLTTLYNLIHESEKKKKHSKANRESKESPDFLSQLKARFSKTRLGPLSSSSPLMAFSCYHPEKRPEGRIVWDSEADCGSSKHWYLADECRCWTLICLIRHAGQHAGSWPHWLLDIIGHTETQTMTFMSSLYPNLLPTTWQIVQETIANVSLAASTNYPALYRFVSGVQTHLPVTPSAPEPAPPCPRKSPLSLIQDVEIMLTKLERLERFLYLFNHNYGQYSSLHDNLHPSVKSARTRDLVIAISLRCLKPSKLNSFMKISKHQMLSIEPLSQWLQRSDFAGILARALESFAKFASTVHEESDWAKKWKPRGVLVHSSEANILDNLRLNIQQKAMHHIKVLSDNSLASKSASSKNSFENHYLFESVPLQWTFLDIPFDVRAETMITLDIVTSIPVEATSQSELIEIIHKSLLNGWLNLSS